LLCPFSKKEEWRSRETRGAHGSQDASKRGGSGATAERGKKGRREKTTSHKLATFNISFRKRGK